MKCPQRGKKKNHSSDQSVRHISNSLEQRRTKQADSKSNTRSPRSKKQPTPPVEIQAAPCRYGTESDPTRTNSSRAARYSKSDSPRIAARQLGARIPPARRGTCRRRGSGGEVEKLPPLRATANGLSFALGEED